MIQISTKGITTPSIKRNIQWCIKRQLAEAAAASPMQVYGDTSLDAPDGSQIHCINLTLHLLLMLDVPLYARCGYTLKVHSQHTFLDVTAFLNQIAGDCSQTLNSIIDIHTTHTMRYTKMLMHTEKITLCE